MTERQKTPFTCRAVQTTQRLENRGGIPMDGTALKNEILSRPRVCAALVSVYSTMSYSSAPERASLSRWVEANAPLLALAFSLGASSASFLTGLRASGKPRIGFVLRTQRK